MFRTLGIILFMVSLMQSPGGAKDGTLGSMVFPEEVVMFADEKDWLLINMRAETDSGYAALVAGVLESARRLLDEPLQQWVNDDGDEKRKLGAARQILSRVIRLGMAWKLTDDDAFLERASEQIEVAISAPDWNTAHFLDTAEVALAVSIGVAWLGNTLDKDTRERWQNALIGKALLPSFDAPPEHLGWLGKSNNWIQVCHAGLTAAALATADKHPELAERVIRRAVRSQQQVANQYAPDGAYVEGPMYWSYGTAFSVILIDLLERNFGTAFGLKDMPGFMRSAEFYRHMISPAGKVFSYGDARPERSHQPVLSWFAGRGQQPWLADDELELGSTALKNEAKGEWPPEQRLSPLALIWTSQETTKQEQPRAWLGRGKNPVAAARTAWDDPDAAYFAIKGGGGALPHGHIDAGAFIFERDGIRWAEDPGMHPYAPLESAGIRLWNKNEDSPRWDVFRLGAGSHNILHFGDSGQRVGPLVEVLEMKPVPGGWKFRADLSPVYDGLAGEVTRTAELGKHGSLHIRDAWKHAATDTLRWQWMTMAEVTVTSDSAKLTRGGRQLELRFSASAPFELNVESTDQLLGEGELPVPGLKRLGLTMRMEPGTSGWIDVRSVQE